MKFATPKTDHRVGQLVIVFNDLTRYIEATGITRTRQDALDPLADCQQKLKTLFPGCHARAAV